MIFFGDLETYSETPIKHGTYRYAETSEIMLFSYAVDDDPVEVWDLTDGSEIPFDLAEALVFADKFVFQNSMFDRTVMRLATNTTPLFRKVGEQRKLWHDTMVQALAHSLPGGLEKLCEVMKVDQDKRKLATGKALIQLFCKPRKFSHRLRREDYASKKELMAAIEEAKARWVGRATRETHPVEWAEFVEYAAYDIHAMRELYHKLPAWNYKGGELALWHLDQKINDRGVCVDLDLVHSAIETVAKEQAVLKDTAQDMTAGWLESTTKRDKMLEYVLMEHGIDLPNLQKDTLERRINDPDLPEALRELLAVRLMASTSSTSKYKAVERGVSSDGCLHGLLQFDGAARTGRWSGRLFQPQNLFRPDMKQHDIEAGIVAIKEGCVDLVYENTMRVCANAMRGVIVARPGKKLVIADLANIEGRKAAWLAGEEWKLDAFREYDAGTGPDLYKLAYSKAFRVHHTEVTKKNRQIGKILELMLQYEGGVGAFITGAASYNIDLDDMAAGVLPSVPQNVVDEAIGFYEWTIKQRRSTFGLPRETFLACDSLKRLWRYAHPGIASIWGELKSAVTSAINKPGETFLVRSLRVRRDGAWLKIQLPSGRFLCYPSPQVSDTGQISYMGVSQYSRKWTRINTYGGKFFENCIAEDTPVLTKRGWCPIQAVRETDEVWDGFEWVPHNGVIYKGKQLVISAFGVMMTPDHLTLTEGGWKNASSSKGYNRAACRLPDGAELPRIGWAQIVVECPVRLWEGRCLGGDGTQEAEKQGDKVIMRLPPQTDDRREEYDARNVGAPRLRCLALYAEQMLTRFSPRLERLWRAGYRSLLPLAGVLRCFLGGYGANVPARAIPRPGGEFTGVLARELCLENSAPAGQQHPADPVSGHPARPLPFFRSGADLQGRAEHPRLPLGCGVAPAGSPDSPEGQHTRRVYDLLDCGPRHQFVVADREGQPLIVHNCTQAASRDVMAYNMQPAEDHGYKILLTVHDELITETPDSPEFNAEHLSEIMAAVPTWAEGLPLAAAGFESYRYRKE
jgi:DNA polymerase